MAIGPLDNRNPLLEGPIAPSITCVSTNAIYRRGLTKRYGDVTALDDVLLTVDRGEIFGFLDPNGAEESTTIDCLLDFVPPPP